MINIFVLMDGPAAVAIITITSIFINVIIVIIFLFGTWIVRAVSDCTYKRCVRRAFFSFFFSIYTQTLPAPMVIFARYFSAIIDDIITMVNCARVAIIVVVADAKSAAVRLRQNPEMWHVQGSDDITKVEYNNKIRFVFDLTIVNARCTLELRERNAFATPGFSMSDTKI